MDSFHPVSYFEEEVLTANCFDKHEKELIRLQWSNLGKLGKGMLVKLLAH